MKIHSTCPTCSPEEGHEIRKRTCSSDINDKGIYLMKCPNGHDFYYIPTFEDYELLFEAGAYSLESENYVEAVSYFANSLEKFRYFVILVSDYNNGLPLDEIEKKRKLVKLSERKIGAFYQAYSYIFKKSPEGFNERQVKVRNEVIHEGKIPSKEETKAYGVAVMNYIKAIQVELRASLPPDITYLATFKSRLLEVLKEDTSLPVENTHQFQFMLDFVNSISNQEVDFDTRFSRSKRSTKFLFSDTSHE
jgi:hypothetical protein